ncbi:DUF2273 domain-containing protein [Leucobacter chromiireducens]|uniref:DUF2273 domain-containing protein n=1 Tax=Leucobacter chromiireducens TaxID=283877 RepID=UPI000F63F8DA|nr:DUF2273 domain-containing protein [Leucobacter chromiireducens]
MSTAVTGAATGALIAIIWLCFGFWACLAVAAAMAIGALIGSALSGRFNIRAALDALQNGRQRQ